MNSLDGLKLRHLSERDRYRPAIEAGEPTGFGDFFPHLLAQNRPKCVAPLRGR
jgi:hypothetical protein